MKTWTNTGLGSDRPEVLEKTRSIRYVRVRCPILVQNSPVWDVLCNHCATRGVQRFSHMPTFCHNSMSRKPHLERLCALADRRHVVRTSELNKYRIHRQTLSRAVDRGLLTKLSRGLYAFGKPSTACTLSPASTLYIPPAQRAVPDAIMCQRLGLPISF
jgi:hypothetical protein